MGVRLECTENGQAAYLGKWRVAEYFYDGGRSRTDPKKYGVRCYLPGMNLNSGYYATTDEAKARIEMIVNHWVNNS